MNQRAKRKEVAQKSLFKSESAAVTAVAAVLLLGLAFTIISVVKLNYVPEWKIDAERDYSYDAWTNMEEVKTRGDIFTRFIESDSNYPHGLSATVPFGMGGGEIPIFEPSKSNSKLAVNTEECTMTITLAKHPDDPRTVDCGGVTYYSENRQYPDQVFRYENGALILAQGSNSQMKRDPLFNINKTIGDNYTVTINAINLTGETASISASTFTALRLTGCSIEPVLNSNDYNESVDSFNLSISTHYTDAWATYLNDTAKEKGLVYNTHYTIESIPYEYVCISFNLTDKLDGIYVNETILGAELGTGGGLTYTGSGGSSGDEGGDEGGDESVMELGRWYYFDTFTGTNTDENGVITTITPEPDPELLKNNDSAVFSETLTKNGVIELNLGFESYTEFETQPKNMTVRMYYQFDNKNQHPTINITPTNSSSESFLIGDDKWHLYNNTFSISTSSPTDLKLNIQLVSGGSSVTGDFSIDYLDIYLS